MANTIVKIMCRPGATLLEMTADGGTGAAAGSPYALTPIVGYLHQAIVPDALAGRWYANAVKDAGGVSYGYGVIHQLANTVGPFMVDDDSDLIADKVEAEVTLDDSAIAAAVQSSFTQYLVVPFLPVVGDFVIVEGNDHKVGNARGGIGPLTVTTPVPLTDPSVTLEVGFTQKIGIAYTGPKFNGTATAVATANPDEYEVTIEIDGANSLGKPPGVYGFDIRALQSIAEGDVDEISILRSECSMRPRYGE